VTNGIRTTALTWVAAADSVVASARWHDRAGGAELGATLIAIGVLAWGFGRGARPRPEPTGKTMPPLRARWWLWGSAALVAAAPLAWFGAREANLKETRTQWALVRPDETWRAFEIPERAHALLRASSIEGLVQNSDSGRARAYAVVVRWDGEAGRDLAGQDHDPSICLPAAGRAVTVLEQTRTVRVHGVPVEFTVGNFEADGRGQHVFYCHWDAWLGRSRERPDLTSISRWRLERAWEGRRRSDAAYVALVVPRAELTDATRWVEEWAERLLRRG